MRSDGFQPLKTVTDIAGEFTNTHDLNESGMGMTGRPGHMEMNGRSTVSYLVRTPRMPFFMLILAGLEAIGLLAFQGRRVIFGVE